ncbi:MAG: phosphatase PAP2 family protein [Acidilobaceae archaeon]
MAYRFMASTILYVVSFILVVVMPLAWLYSVTVFWSLISLLGGSVGFYVIILPVVYHSLPRVYGFSLALSLLLATSTTGFAKDLFKLSRPPGAIAGGYGFPSGHATSVSSFWGFLALRYPWPPLIAFTVVFIMAVSISRLALGVHYPRDVVGGVLVGFTTATIVYMLSHRLSVDKLIYAGLASSIIFLIASLLGYGIIYSPSVLLGLSIGEVIASRLKLYREPGPLYGILGSITAAPLTMLAYSLEYSVGVSITLYTMAGLLALIAPRVAMYLRVG